MISAEDGRACIVTTTVSKKKSNFLSFVGDSGATLVAKLLMKIWSIGGGQTFYSFVTLVESNKVARTSGY